MKRSKAILIANLSIGILVGSYTNVSAKVDNYTIKTKDGSIYEYNKKEVDESFLKNNDGSKGFLHKDFLDKLSKGELYSYHDDSGKYVSHKEVANVFSKTDDGKGFSLDEEVKKLSKMEMPEEVYRVSEKDGELVKSPVKAKDKSIYKEVSFDKDLYVTGNEILLQKVNIQGTLFLDPGTEGTANLEDVKADNVVILSGAKDSIHFNNVIANTLIINSTSNVRIESKGETKIGKTVVQSFAILDSKSGSLGEVTITIAESGEKTVELRGEFKEPIIIQSAAKLVVAEDSKLDVLEVNTKEGENVTLKGNIGIVNLKTASELKMESGTTAKLVATTEEAKKAVVQVNEGAKVAVDNNIENVKADNQADITKKDMTEEKKELEQGNTGTVTPGGGSSGGGSGSPSIPTKTQFGNKLDELLKEFDKLDDMFNKVGNNQEGYLNLGNVAWSKTNKNTNTNLNTITINVVDDTQTLTDILDGMEATMNINKDNVKENIKLFAQFVALDQYLDDKITNQDDIINYLKAKYPANENGDFAYDDSISLAFNMAALLVHSTTKDEILGAADSRVYTNVPTLELNGYKIAKVVVGNTTVYEANNQGKGNISIDTVEAAFGVSGKPLGNVTLAELTNREITITFKNASNVEEIYTFVFN